MTQTQAMVVHEPKQWLALAYQPAEIEMLRRFICSGGKEQASDGELMFYVSFCRANGLDPLRKQCYLLITNKGPQIAMGIDGLRGQAAGTGEYAGQELPVFQETKEEGLQCVSTVYRFVQGQKCAFYGIAWMKESRGTTPNWSQRPKTMLAKCAEAQALRKAFPKECGPYFTPEELEERDVTPTEAPRAAAVSDLNARLSGYQKPPQAPVMEATFVDAPAPVPSTAGVSSDTGSSDLDADGSAAAAADFRERLARMVSAFDALGRGTTVDQLLTRVRSVTGRDHVTTLAQIEEPDLETLRDFYAELRGHGE